jgi:hypothetical protein
MVKLTQPITIPRWKYHLGHTLTAAVVAFLALSFGASLLSATLLGTLAWPLLHESVLERIFYRDAPFPMTDHVADFIQHQPLWIVYFLRGGEPLLAVVAATVIGVLYWTTLDWGMP